MFFVLLKSKNYLIYCRINKGIMKLRKRVIIASLTIVVGAIVGTYYYLYYTSGNRADIKLIDLTWEAVDSQTVLRDLLTYKKFRFTLTYDVLGGFVPVACKDFTLTFKIEDLDVATVQLDDFQISGWWNRNTESVPLDVSNISSIDVQYIQNKFYNYKRELKITVESSATLDAAVTAKTVKQQLTKYFLLGSPSINLIDVYWGEPSARAEEAVDFHVILSSPYRETQIAGNLTVVVREDVFLESDRDVKTFPFSVSLASRQSADYSQPFQVYKDFLSTRGFFLKVYWEGEQIYEMEEGYPPRLSVS